MNEKDITQAIEEHTVRNQELRTRFETRKVALDEPRPVDFHFWAWTQRDAAVLARSLYALGFLIRLIAPARSDSDHDRWSIEAGARLSLNEALGHALTEKLVTLAAKEDAVFDGWGTSV